MNVPTITIDGLGPTRGDHKTNKIIDMIFAEREWFDSMLQDGYTFILMGTDIAQLVNADTDLVSPFYNDKMLAIASFDLA